MQKKSEPLSFFSLPVFTSTYFAKLATQQKYDEKSQFWFVIHRVGHDTAEEKENSHNRLRVFRKEEEGRWVIQQFFSRIGNDSMLA